MGYATILGLDLGKFKSVCCATRGRFNVRRVRTNRVRAGLADLD